MFGLYSLNKKQSAVSAVRNELSIVCYYTLVHRACLDMHAPLNGRGAGLEAYVLLAQQHGLLLFLRLLMFPVLSSFVGLVCSYHSCGHLRAMQSIQCLWQAMLTDPGCAVM